ncbi:MAG: rod shape-determining protein RodA [Ignavibacteria bacterium]|nr:rod shape-determining protein RodA [Ignavibacteria bacterium]
MAKKINIFSKFDFITLFLTLLILAIGLISIYSATFGNVTQVDYFKKQLIFAFVGLVIMISISFIPPRYLAITSYYVYGFSILLLILVLIFGKTINGNKSWFYIAGFGIQPSEFAKVAIIMAVSFFLNTGDKKKDINEIPVLIKTCFLVFIPVILVKLQNDTGTSLVILSMLLPILWGAGLSPFMLFAIISPIALAILSFFNTTLFYIAIFIVIVCLFLFKRSLFLSIIVLVINAVAGLSSHFIFSKLALYQQQRILALFDPTLDPLKSGYNVIQSKVAIGSGGLTGKGFLQGTQTQLKFIPEQWTDFIFCMIGEEFGFIGAMFLITILLALILKIFYNSFISKNSYLSLMSACIGGLFLIQMVLNIGMTVGITPVIGIPLPLVSYGVSSLLSFMLLIGFAMNTYRHREVYL